MIPDEVLWAGAWALFHATGLAIMLVLRHRSAHQIRVAERWRDRAIPEERQEASDLVALTRDRHRRNDALVVVAAAYLALGLLVLSWTIYPWITQDTYQIVARLILTGGEVVWIGSAWLSVMVGDQIAHAKRPETRSGDRP